MFTANCPKHSEQSIVAMGAYSVTLECGFQGNSDNYVHINPELLKICNHHFGYESSSNCILPRGHMGDHRDDSGGTWLNHSCYYLKD